MQSMQFGPDIYFNLPVDSRDYGVFLPNRMGSRQENVIGKYAIFWGRNIAL